jgi:DNA mismatch endonuclease (patch repair protein)
MDVFSVTERSRIMSRINGRNTGPELSVRRTVHGLGYRYRLHVKSLPGTPDIVLPRLAKVIQVHGCFWHGHRGCRRATMPQTNVTFWRDKISANMARDRRTERQLRQLGWGVMTIWSCQVKDRPRLARRVLAFLSQ